jgi:hypothetical protein
MWEEEEEEEEEGEDDDGEERRESKGERGEKGEMRAAAAVPVLRHSGLIHPFSSPVSSISSRPPGLIYSASSSQFPFAVRKKRRLHNKRCLA